MKLVKVRNITGYKRGAIVSLPDNKADVYLANGQAEEPYPKNKSMDASRSSGTKNRMMDTGKSQGEDTSRETPKTK